MDYPFCPSHALWTVSGNDHSQWFSGATWARFTAQVRIRYFAALRLLSEVCQDEVAYTSEDPFSWLLKEEGVIQVVHPLELKTA